MRNPLGHPLASSVSRKPHSDTVWWREEQVVWEVLVTENVTGGATEVHKASTYRELLKRTRVYHHSFAVVIGLFLNKRQFLSNEQRKNILGV